MKILLNKHERRIFIIIVAWFFKSSFSGMEHLRLYHSKRRSFIIQPYVLDIKQNIKLLYEIALAPKLTCIVKMTAGWVGILILMIEVFSRR